MDCVKSRNNNLELPVPVANLNGFLQNLISIFTSLSRPLLRLPVEPFDSGEGEPVQRHPGRRAERQGPQRGGEVQAHGLRHQVRAYVHQSKEVKRPIHPS